MIFKFYQNLRENSAMRNRDNYLGETQQTHVGALRLARSLIVVLRWMWLGLTSA